MLYSKNKIPLIIMVILFHRCLRRNANVKADIILKIKNINHEHIWESDKNIWYKKSLWDDGNVLT